MLRLQISPEPGAPIWNEPVTPTQGFWPPIPPRMHLERDDRRDFVDDILVIAEESPFIVEARTPEEVARHIHEFILHYPNNPAAYLTGGLECGYHHQSIFEMTVQYCRPYKVLTIMGLEPDEWIETTKGRPPRYDLATRKAFWRRILPPPAVIFQIPSGTEDYDALSAATGTYRHPNVLHLASLDDPPHIREARRIRAFTDRHFWLFAIGLDPNGDTDGVMIHPSHTSDRSATG